MSETTETQPAAEDDPIAVRRAKREALIAAGRTPTAMPLPIRIT